MLLGVPVTFPLQSFVMGRAVRFRPSYYNKTTMRDLFIDIETYSSVDIAECGAYKYAESDDFEILLIGYAVDDEPVRVIDLAGGLPDGFEGDTEAKIAFLDPDFLELFNSPLVRLHAHNAVFERICFVRVGMAQPASRWYCTSVLSAYCGLPLSLDQVSKVLDLKDKKLASGKLLIKYFSCPCKPTAINKYRTRNLPKHNPEKWAMYIEYNTYDVLAEREIYNRLKRYEIPAFERELYALDQRINDHGVKVDLDLASSAVAVSNEYTEELTLQAQQLTGLPNPNSVVQLKQWVKDLTGETVDSFSKDSISDLRKGFSGHPEILEMLDIRASLSKTSVKKYDAMMACAGKDSRARGLFQFYGANRTGRWAGRLIQLQNLSKNHFDGQRLADARDHVKSRDVDMLRMVYGDVQDLLSQLVRTALVAPEGKTFSVADFSAIEARVISWLASEEWRMRVFHGDGKIYEATGSRMFGVPVSSITKGSELRAKAKIAELALGYGGGVGALTRMGGDKMGLSDDEMRGLTLKWREANPSIVKMWADFENAAFWAVRHCEKVEMPEYRGVYFICDGEYMRIGLPSGRELFYRNPLISSKFVGRKEVRSLLYEGTNQETKQWTQVDTYGGKLTENIVQAIARDLLAFAMMNVSKGTIRHSYEIVMHIHDEVIAEIADDGTATEAYDDMVKLMSVPPKWAADLPLRADGYLTKFYLKD